MTHYYSQFRQDEFLHKNVYGNFHNGVVVDVGAHNGTTFSNSLFFEQQLNWKSVNIEPIPAVFENLKKNRPNSINLCVAIDRSEGNGEFICNEGYTDMLSGLVEHQHPSHINRIQNEIQIHGGKSTIVTVRTRRLDNVLNELDITRVHYLSIDVEGGEKSVIDSINFDQVYIDVIEFEDNYPPIGQKIVDFLQSKGYIRLHLNTLDIFMIHQKSPFYQNMFEKNQVRFLYGSMMQFQDVTLRAIDAFVKDNQIVIPANIRFNDILSDTHPNVVKTLTIHLHNQKEPLQLPESRQNDFVLLI